MKRYTLEEGANFLIWLDLFPLLWVCNQVVASSPPFNFKRGMNYGTETLNPHFSMKRDGGLFLWASPT